MRKVARLFCTLFALASCSTGGDTGSAGYVEDAAQSANEGPSSKAEARSEVALSAEIPASGVDVICESWDLEPASCPVGFFIGRAYLVEQYSIRLCRKGKTWDQEGFAIWVSDGCRGKFHADPE